MNIFNQTTLNSGEISTSIIEEAINNGEKIIMTDGDIKLHSIICSCEACVSLKKQLLKDAPDSLLAQIDSVIVQVLINDNIVAKGEDGKLSFMRD